MGPPFFFDFAELRTHLMTKAHSATINARLVRRDANAALSRLDSRLTDGDNNVCYADAASSSFHVGGVPTEEASSMRTRRHRLSDLSTNLGQLSNDADGCPNRDSYRLNHDEGNKSATTRSSPRSATVRCSVTTAWWPRDLLRCDVINCGQHRRCLVTTRDWHRRGTRALDLRVAPAPTTAARAR